jgi:hypothetical protein
MIINFKKFINESVDDIKSEYFFNIKLNTEDALDLI